MTLKESLELSIKLLNENGFTDEADTIQSHLLKRDKKLLAVGDDVTVLRKINDNQIEMLPGRIAAECGLILVDAYSVKFKDSCFYIIAPAGNILKYNYNRITL